MIHVISKLFCGQITTGSLEIGKFLRRQSVSIFRATAHALHLTGFLERLLRLISFENKQYLNQLITRRKKCPHVCFAFCAGFYTTALTARKLCSATLRQFIVWILCCETFARKTFSFLKNADYNYIPEMLGNQLVSVQKNGYMSNPSIKLFIYLLDFETT